MQSYRTDILPLFEGRDFTCMGPMGWPLDDVGFMTDASNYGDFSDYGHARETHARLITDDINRRMPKGKPAWSAEKIAKYERWMAEGFHP